MVNCLSSQIFDFSMPSVSQSLPVFLILLISAVLQLYRRQPIPDVKCIAIHGYPTSHALCVSWLVTNFRNASEAQALEVSRMCWRNCTQLEMNCHVEHIGDNTGNYMCVPEGHPSKQCCDRYDHRSSSMVASNCWLSQECTSAELYQMTSKTFGRLGSCSPQDRHREDDECFDTRVSSCSRVKESKYAPLQIPTDMDTSNCGRRLTSSDTSLQALASLGCGNGDSHSNT